VFLTLSKSRRKSNAVFPPQDNFYARWREQSGAFGRLREDAVEPPEHLLRLIWQHQRIRREQNVTVDHRRIRILHPGFVNHEAGPDFRGAVIQFENDPPLTGEVEVDIRSNGWRAHGHDRDPNFKNVILRAVWQETSQDKGPPMIALEKILDAPLPELNIWLAGQSGEGLPESLRGRCCAPLRELSPELLGELLREAGWVRFTGKAAQFQARARHVGWERTLWEGLFRALGYKHNTWPMQCLAESLPDWSNAKLSVTEVQARLLGLSGLLPNELTRAKSSADDYVQRVWNQWWRERDQFAGFILPRSVWKFHSLRPANHPQRRLALAAHWLAANNLPERLTRWCALESEDSPDESLLEILQSPRDDFWSWHWTLRSARLKKPQPLLGNARATDLAVNVILPWLFARAVEGRNKKLQFELQKRFNSWPAAEDNATLKLARQRLLDGAGRGILKTAATQQGLLQIVRDFCEHSNALCEDCRFPNLVKDWKAQKLT
jgi:hypothetical protein